MYGKSWGGFNGLQVASCQPAGLAAVISLYSTDSRFEDDIHWKGGCVLGGGMLSWAATMFCWDARPPQPQYRQDWAQLWRQRLDEAGSCLVATWLNHKTNDAYWRHGSVGENPARVAVPVLAIGGWHDGYTNCALRMPATLPDCKAIVGPWSHNWPDTAVPGPNIAFMDECLRFWAEHLGGQPGEWSTQSRVRWFQCRGELPPAPSVAEWPGSWQAGEVGQGAHSVKLQLSEGAEMLEGGTGLLGPVEVPWSAGSGLLCGEWLSFGSPDLPGDHRLVAALQASWTSRPVEVTSSTQGTLSLNLSNPTVLPLPTIGGGLLREVTRLPLACAASQPCIGPTKVECTIFPCCEQEDLHLFGRCELKVEVEADRGPAQLWAGLCHQTKAGYRLLTYGLQSLDSKFRPAPPHPAPLYKQVWRRAGS